MKRKVIKRKEDEYRDVRELDVGKEKKKRRGGSRRQEER